MMWPRLICLSALLAHGSLHAQQPAPQTAPAQKTVITSQEMEWQGTPLQNFFYFHGDVKVEGNNMLLTCDRLSVTTGAERETQGTVGQIGAVQEIIAEGKVHITQAGRDAYAGRAEMDTVEGVVTLRDQPRVVQGETEIIADPGYMLVLYKNEMKIRLVPDPDLPTPPASRSRLKLGGIPDMGLQQDPAKVTTGKQLAPAAPLPPKGQQPEAQPTPQP
ncbi:MAG: LptA/OstA family protein [Verrucomicrobiota bacterium JB022]|nr:LptA/OstA family protein [Verrucomicrobiota bacterium JB022]